MEEKVLFNDQTEKGQGYPCPKKEMLLEFETFLLRII